MTFSIKKKTLRKIVSSLTMFATVVSMSGMMAFSAVAATVADGALIKSDAVNSDGTPTYESLDIYIVKIVGTKQFKRLMLNPTVFESYGHLNYGDVQTITQAEMDTYTTSSLVRVDTDPDEKVYAMAPDGDIGSKSWVNLTSTQFVDEAGSDADSIYTINSVDGGNYTTVGDVTTVTELTTFYTSGNLPDTTPVPAGGVSVSLAATTPASATVPSNATGVVFTNVNLSASDEGDAIITGIAIKRTGVGATTDISKVYLYDGATRLTTGKTVSASTNEAIFTNLNVTVAAGATRTLSVVANIANSVSGQHAFGIASASAITTASAVSGSFPVTGNYMSLSTTPVGKIDVEASTATYTRKVGETNVTVGNFTVYVNATEDAQFEGITLYNSGRDILSNVQLYRGSDLVGSGVQSGSDFVITLDTPYAIAKSQSAIFTVKADVGGRDADTATLYVRYSTDVVVVGNTYGYNLGVDVAEGGSAVNSYVDEVVLTTLLTNVTTMEAGQLTITTSGPGASDVSKNTNNTVLLNFAIASQATVDVSKFIITIVGDGANLIPADVDNLDLVIDGIVVGTKSTVVIGDNIFTDTFTLIGGETTQGQIIIDINNSAAGDETIAATLKDMTATANFLAKTTDGDTVTDIIPSGNIVGKTMTVTSASLTLDLASSPASGQTFVQGTTDATLAGFAFKAGSASDVKVTSVKLTAYLMDTAAWDKVQTSGAKSVLTAVGLYDGTTLVAPKKTLTVGTSDITVTFDSLDLTISKGTTKTLVAKADLSTSLISGTDDKVALTIAVLGDVVAEYGTGTNLAPILNTNNNTPSIFQTIATAGTLTMANDSATPSANLVVAGSQDVVYTTFKLTSTKEAFKVTKLNVKNSANDSNFTGITLSYKDETNATKTANGTLIGNVASLSFAAGDEIYVPKDSSAIVTIKGNLNTISGGATNANASVLSADYDTGFEATGVASGEKVTVSGSVAGAQTITVGGTALAGGEDPAAANVVVPTPTGTANISVDVAVAATNIAIATAIAAAIDANANWSATSGGGLVVTATAASTGTWSNVAIDPAALIVVIDAADADADDTTLAIASTVSGVGADGVGASMALYESVPAVAFTSDTPSGDLIPSTNTLVAKIKIAASATKDVTFSATGAANNMLVLKIAATGAALAADDDVMTIKDKNGNVLCTDTIDLGTDVANCDFASRDLVVGAGTEEIISVYLDTTELATAGNSMQVWLDDAADANLIWSIDGNLANYSTGITTLRGDIYGGSLVKP